MSEPIIAALSFLVSFLIGNQIHERYHYWAGKFCGTDPKYAGRLTPVFPTRTEFRNRESLTNRQVRLVSIPGHFFFLILVCLAIIPGSPSSYIEFALVGVSAGGGIISWTDDMAARDPEHWLEFFS